MKKFLNKASTVLFVFLLLNCTGKTESNSVELPWPKTVPGFVKVAASDWTAVALDEYGKVWTWGRTTFNSSKDSKTFGAVPVWTKENRQLDNISDIACSGAMCMAVDTDGFVWAWGSDFLGKLGTTPPRANYYPQKVVTRNGRPLENILSISIGSTAAFALTKDNSVFAWGSNYGGLLRKDAKRWKPEDSTFQGLEHLQEKTYGGQEGAISPYPIKIIENHDSELYPVQEIESSNSHVLVRNSKNEIWGWGGMIHITWPEYYTGLSSQIGKYKDHIAEKSIAGDVVSPIEIIDIETSQSFSAALLDNGTALTWGDDMYGSLGHGEYYQRTSPDFVRDTRKTRYRYIKKDDYWEIEAPGPILTDIRQVALVNTGMVLLKNNGHVFYQGSDYTGNGSFVKTPYPVSDITLEDMPRLTQVLYGKDDPVDNIKSIWTNRWYTSYMIDENNNIWSWGGNLNGVVGDDTVGSENDKLYPVRVKFFYFDDETEEWIEY